MTIPITGGHGLQQRIVITDELHNQHQVSGTVVVQPGGYVTIGRNADAATNGGVGVDYSTGSDVFLFNSSDRLVLLNTLARRSIGWRGTTGPPSPTQTVLRCR